MGLLSELRNELLIEFALVFTVYLYVVCALACCVRGFLKYDCVKAVIHSKTYFGMEKDACMPSKPLNGVCLGVVFTYKSKEYTGYVQVDNDKHKIGNTIDLCVEKKDPSVFSLEMKRDVLTLLYWLLLAILLAKLATIKLALWSGKTTIYSKLLVSNLMIGLVFLLIVLMMKK